jgi:hypothetical protein
VVWQGSAGDRRPYADRSPRREPWEDNENDPAPLGAKGRSLVPLRGLP